MGFGAWFTSLPAVLKVLVITGIVLGSFAVGASLVTSTLSAWRHLSALLSRRKGGGKRDSGT